jgi:hypothetical protein
MTFFHAILQVVLYCAVLAVAIWLMWLALEKPDEKRNRRSIFKGLLLGTATGTCVGLAGFFLANTPATQGMGQVMFLLVPFCAGFSIALVARGRNATWAAGLLATLGSLCFLVAGKIEGLLCAFLAFPVLAFALGVGAVLGYLFRRYVLDRLRHQVTSLIMVFALTPTLILLDTNWSGHPSKRFVGKPYPIGFFSRRDLKRSGPAYSPLTASMSGNRC